MFGFLDYSSNNIDNKKTRAKEIKDILKTYESDVVCDLGKKEIEKLKEEQYRLAREI
jgi:hypothetical protein